MIKKLNKSKKDIMIIIYCLRQVQFCRLASKTMTPSTTHSDSMQDTYNGLSVIFSELGKNFEQIAKCAGFKLDLNGKNGQIILEKINSLPSLNKTQAKKCIKEISSLL